MYIALDMDMVMNMDNGIGHFSNALRVPCGRSHSPLYNLRDTSGQGLDETDQPSCWSYVCVPVYPSTCLSCLVLTVISRASRDRAGQVMKGQDTMDTT